jgi:high affinity Mn2+ porin
LPAGGPGAGIIVDRQLPMPGPEQIVETYYSFAAFSFAKVTGDCRFANGPAYNRQRGLLSALALRLPAHF